MLKEIGNYLAATALLQPAGAAPSAWEFRRMLRKVLPVEYHSEAIFDPPNWAGNLRQEADNCFTNLRLIERNIKELSDSGLTFGSKLTDLERLADAEMEIHETLVPLKRAMNTRRSLRKRLA